MTREPHQSDFICLGCPLGEGNCDEESLFCAFRWATNPNKAQLAAATVRLIPQRLTDADRSRKWRQTNRERYNEVQRDARAKRKAEDPMGYAEHLRNRRVKVKTRQRSVGAGV